MDVAGHLEQLTPTEAENAYNRLTSYRFVQRYVEGKSVADISWKASGYGTHLLAESAKSVTSLANSTEALESASTIYSAPNVSYQRVSLPELPYPEGHFDAVVAFEVVEKLEHPGDLVREAKRVLKSGGVFFVSTPDKQAYSNDRNYRNSANKREMYVPEFRELLERHFEQVRTYRQGTVAGSLIFEAPEELSTASVESTSFYSTNPSFNAKPPTTYFVIAVCSNSDISRHGNQQSYLLVDHSQRVFDENADYREDVNLLRNEIQYMQETEVQAFQDVLKLHRSEIVHLEAQLKRAEAQLKHSEAQLKRAEAHMNHQIQALKTHISTLESSKAWRLFNLYRRLRGETDSLEKPK